MIRIADLIIPLTYDMKMLEDIVAKRLRIDNGRIESIKIVKRSINSIDKQNIYFDMVVLVCVSGDEKEVIAFKRGKGISIEFEQIYAVAKQKTFRERPVVVGCGPAGMFAALTLARAGARPILLERGSDVDSRLKKVLEFWHAGILETQTNVQFGEGGAGTFSDGKLKVGFKDSRKIMVLSELVSAGAPPEIMYVSKPHIGTDRLRETVKVIREKIICLGGEVHFNAMLTDVLIKDNAVRGVRYLKNGVVEEIETNNVVLAIGHSARDTFEMLLNSGICIEQKAFSVGVRIEHPQSLIDGILYGEFAGHPALGAADYRMVVHLKNARAVYSFCMCPGGSVVAATSEENHLVTNGMSDFARNGMNANSALLVTIDKKDLMSDHPLAGVEFARRIEKMAFLAGGGGYKAPVQRLGDFLQNINTKNFGDVCPTYLPGTGFAQVREYLPDYVADSLRQGIIEMDEWMPGFACSDALLTGAETRSASPVRICRDERLQAAGIEGLYPCGEGAGYSGGIISAAVDGVLCAERILSAY